jgi:TonB family protein
MSRFEKKCYIASASLHGLLLICFVFGSAFLGSKEIVTIPPVVTFAVPTDKMFSGGGNPNGGGTPTPAPKVETPPAPTPTPPQPEPAKPEPKPEPLKQERKQPEPEKEPIKVTKTEKVEKTVEKVPKDKVPDKTPKDTRNTSKDVAKTPLNLKTVRITNNLAQVQAELAAKRAADARQRAEYAAYVDQRNRLLGEVSRVAGNVGSTLGTGTVAEPLGPGGKAFANYGSLIIEHYKRAVYASNPQSDYDASAVIKIVVTRDGTVRSSQWVRRTNSPLLNKAVDRAMNTVRSLPSFPPESKDAERSFNITIEFEASRSA